uniref:Uncharacterized protein n=1 Tax=Parascaris equorum TaxID=6256 RepID=A0A914RRP5_PAREQ
MGVEKHPMNEVFFYDHKAHAQQLEPYRIDQALLKHKSSLFGGSQSIMIYVSATTKAKSNAAQIIAELLAAFEKFMREESHEHLRLRRSHSGEWRLDGRSPVEVFFEKVIVDVSERGAT